jgi:BMFP domain-containing protein YqiC
MATPPFPPLSKAFADLQAKVGDLMRASPTAELEGHMKAALSAAMAKMDLLTREDFELQQQMLSKALEKMAALERRVVELEAEKLRLEKKS